MEVAPRLALRYFEIGIQISLASLTIHLFSLGPKPHRAQCSRDFCLSECVFHSNVGVKLNVSFWIDDACWPWTQYLLLADGGKLKAACLPHANLTTCKFQKFFLGHPCNKGVVVDSLLLC